MDQKREKDKNKAAAKNVVYKQFNQCKALSMKGSWV